MSRTGTGCDRGSVSGFVVVITMAVLACAGLVIDGARVVGAKVEAADHAENAARAGAQEIIARDGVVTLDVPKARQRASAYLASVGAHGSVEVTPAGISVTVSESVDTTLLSLVGVDTRSVSATRSADPVTE
ncbi:MAG: pilus assembly protein TadG-related protein [Ilumatobacteraceae bacterium]